jgi:hypothetical protein
LKSDSPILLNVVDHINLQTLPAQLFMKSEDPIHPLVMDTIFAQPGQLIVKSEPHLVPLFLVLINPQAVQGQLIMKNQDRITPSFL